MTQNIGIIDYGAGNIGSIQNMIRRLGGESYVIQDGVSVLNANKIILPGVGSFDYGMQMLIDNNLVEPLKIYINSKQLPLLGICLGAQLLTKKSEEGQLSGLGLFDAEVLHFSKLENTENVRIPHMGWNYIHYENEKQLLCNLPEQPRFYFVHSYYIHSNASTEVLCTANYKTPFAAGLQKDNVWAVQFHPEKSHKYGMQLFQNFLNL
jgi:imidazole glycerol-phosphate synthase subunit HisH